MRVLLVFHQSKMDDISFSFDQKVCSSAPEPCNRPEKWATKNSSFGNTYSQNLIIDVQDSECKKKKKEKVTKEQPIWMSESTVEGATTATINNAGKFWALTNSSAALLQLNVVFLENDVKLVHNIQ